MNPRDDATTDAPLVPRTSGDATARDPIADLRRQVDALRARLDRVEARLRGSR